MSAPLDPRVLEEAAPGAWLTPRTAFTALLLAALVFRSHQRIPKSA